MPSPQIERKLAAIMFTDIAGYTAQMSKDEDKAFALIQKKRDLLLPLVEKYEGKLIKEIGDGTLTRYFKADSAINCASRFQSKTDADLNVRVGIHTGEVIVDKEDVFGDVVNVASRLQSIAVAGSILVSKETIDMLEIKNGVEFLSLGMQSLKGVGRLIEVYAIKDDDLVIPNPNNYTTNKIEIHSDNDVPSVAILPFKNKGNRKDEFYAHGITNDLISKVTRSGLVRVASLSDIESLEHKKFNKYQLSKKLFVRYIVNGILWKMDNIFQISIALFDTKKDQLIWSDSWQENWDYLSIIKSKIAEALIKAFNLKIKGEKENYISPDAYKFLKKGQYIFEKRKKSSDINKAEKLIKKSIEIENNFTYAHLVLGNLYETIGKYNIADKIYKKAQRISKKINDNWSIAHSHLYISSILTNQGKYDNAIEECNIAYSIWKKIGEKKHLGHCYNYLAINYFRKTEYDQAIKYFDKGLAIEKEYEDEKGMTISLTNIGSLYGMLGDYTKALRYYDKSNKLCKKVGVFFQEAANLNNIAVIYGHQYRDSEALQMYLNAKDIYLKLKDKRAVAITYSNIAGCYKILGFENPYYYKKALIYHNKALKLRFEHNNKEGIATTYKKLGELYLEQKMYVKSKEYLFKALYLRMKLKAEHKVGHTFFTIAKVYQLNNQIALAIRYFYKAKNIFVKMDNKMEIFRTECIILELEFIKKIDVSKRFSNLFIMKNKWEINGFKENYQLWSLCKTTGDTKRQKKLLSVLYKQIQSEKQKITKKKNREIFSKLKLNKHIIEEWEKVK